MPRLGVAHPVPQFAPTFSVLNGRRVSVIVAGALSR